MKKDDIHYNGNEPVEFCGELKHETDKAFLVHDGASNVWLPKSQVMDYRKIDSKTNDWEFTIPTWLAVEKGII